MRCSNIEFFLGQKHWGGRKKDWIKNLMHIFLHEFFSQGVKEKSSTVEQQIKSLERYVESVLDLKKWSQVFLVAFYLVPFSFKSSNWMYAQFQRLAVSKFEVVSSEKVWSTNLRDAVTTLKQCWITNSRRGCKHYKAILERCRSGRQLYPSFWRGAQWQDK